MESSPSNLKSKIFSIENEESFHSIALEVFRYQSTENRLYANFLAYSGIEKSDVQSLNQIPFLPISFFKSHQIISGKDDPITYFQSSGTGGSVSKHYLTDLSLYDESLIRGFMFFYGDPQDYIFVAVLPSYQNNPFSSLIYMMNKLIKASKHPLSNYYKPDDELTHIIDKAKKSGRKVFLWSVTYALVNLATSGNCIQLSEPHIVLETGGMKGRGKELTREELHAKLTKAFNRRNIHSEYGMCELLSQAYSKADGIFNHVPWMKIMLRDVYDPKDMSVKAGAINIIDLANFNSCSFIATDDLGRITKEGILISGRMDNSEVRGCNVLEI